VTRSKDRGWLRVRGSSRPELLWALVGVIALAATASAIVWGRHDRATLRLKVQFSANACCSWQVWVNGTDVSAITVLPMHWGKTDVYSVPLRTSHIDHLRLPLGQQRGGVVTVKRIWISRGSRTVATIDPATLPITAYDAKRPSSSPSARFVATGDAPFIDVPVTVDAHESTVQLLLARAGGQPAAAFAAVLLLGTVLALLIGAARERPLLIGMLVALAIVIRGLPSLSWRLGLHDGVAHAVGFASYAGVWKARERFLFEAAVVAAVVLSALAAAWARHRRRRGDGVATADAIDPQQEPTAQRRRVGALLIGTPIAIVALAGAPDLRLYVGGGPVQFVPSWDSNNLIFWRYLLQKKNLYPVKDFFWPYGYQWLFHLAVPWGLVGSYVGSVAIWTMVSAGAYLTLRRGFQGPSLALRGGLLAAFWLSAEVLNVAPFSTDPTSIPYGETRYVAALGVVLMFTGVSPKDSAFSRRRLTASLALLGLLLFEVAQAGYALVPIAFATLAVLVTHRGEISRRGWLARSAVSVGLPCALAASILAATGTLSQTAAFYKEITFASATFAYPSMIDSWVTHPTTLAALIFWTVPLALALGVWGTVMNSGERRSMSIVVIALALLGAMIMQKQVLRPDISLQIWLPVVFSLAFWAVAAEGLIPRRRWLVVAAAAGAMAGVALSTGGYHAAATAVAAGPAHVWRSGGALINERAGLDETAGQAFTPASFAKFRPEQPVVRALKLIPAVRRGGDVWILGDDPPITMMLGHSWPYYFSDFYTTSPLEFQRDVLRRLNDHPPVRVVWNFSSQAMVFDTVPHYVRVPLLFQYAVRSYVPERIVGSFAILRARRPGEPIPLAWWRDKIGEAADFGHIPSVAALPAKRCTRDGGACGTYLVAEVTRGVPLPTAFDVPVKFGRLAFDVKFAATRGVRRYVVPLFRLWWWKAAPASMRLSLRTGMKNGVSVSIVRRQDGHSVLY
jgi:hypothetical protein